MPVIALTRIEEVWVGRVHPPGISTIVIQFLKIFPIDSSSLRAECIVHLYARRIVHTWRPDMRETTLRPCLDRQQETLLIKFTELLSLGSETCPDRDHEVSMLIVDILYHLRSLGKVFCQEVHSIPQIVGTPILPVLYDTVERHLQLTILIHYALRLSSSLISLLRLPEAVRPQREHRHVAREMAHLCNHSVGRAAIHEIVVDTLPCLRVEGHAVGIVFEESRRVVLPIYAPALYRLHNALEVLEVRLLHTLLLTATVHLAVLNGAKSVDCLVLVEGESLAHLSHVAALFSEQHLSFCCQEGQVTLCVLPYGQFTTRPGVSFPGYCHLFRLSDDHQRLCRLSLYDMYNTWRKELHLHLLCKSRRTIPDA